MDILSYITEKVRLFQLERFDKMKKKRLIPLFLFLVSIEIHAYQKDSLSFIIKSFMVYDIFNKFISNFRCRPRMGGTKASKLDKEIFS